MESALSNIRHYQSLGLKNTGASLEEVKRAYKKLSLRYHPDRNSDPSATAKFQEISTAYNVLSTPRKRQVSGLAQIVAERPVRHQITPCARNSAT